MGFVKGSNHSNDNFERGCVGRTWCDGHPGSAFKTASFSKVSSRPPPRSRARALYLVIAS